MDAHLSDGVVMTGCVLFMLWGASWVVSCIHPRRHGYGAAGQSINGSPSCQAHGREEPGRSRVLCNGKARRHGQWIQGTTSADWPSDNVFVLSLSCLWINDVSVCWSDLQYGAATARRLRLPQGLPGRALRSRRPCTPNFGGYQRDHETYHFQAAVRGVSLTSPSSSPVK